ncbi:Crp/Fnr family transcriptional regulator [Rhodovulum strictum]|uniref:Helix-turn-helix domain-containing protein n=1 Tax=Rhodovulum strictum TaxID=58314 RepID=A0A844BJH7_9RHOB|nr:Crp/Fnr family transcriptional regulator [Rhodovulum strictum]MRH22618.1 helix-turn-helix domain-containing protein [Rhodovulum strictum]
MDLNHARRRIREVGWLRSLPGPFCTALLAGSNLRRCGTGEVLFHRDDPAPDFLGLVDGLLYVYSEAGDEEARLVFVAHPGWWAGSIAIVGGSERRCTVVARAPSVLLSVPRMHVEALARRDSATWRHVATNVAAQYDSLVLLLQAQANPDPRVRLLISLQRLHRFNDGATIFPITQSELAEMSGLSRNSANRAMRQFVAEGLVETGYGWLRIVDPAALAAALCQKRGDRDNCDRRAG